MNTEVRTVLALSPVSFTQSYEIGTVLLFIFQMRKLRLGEHPIQSNIVVLGGTEL